MKFKKNSNKIDIKKIQFGVIFFDEKIEKNTTNFKGWLSIDGAEATRIIHVKEIPDHVVLWSNLKAESLWGSGIAKQKDLLKSSEYLKTDIFSLCKEIGIQEKPFAERAKIISDIFSKMMYLAIDYYHLDDFSQKDFHLQIRDQIITQKDRSIDMTVDEALLRSYQNMVICNDIEEQMLLLEPRAIRNHNLLYPMESDPVSALEKKYLEKMSSESFTVVLKKSRYAHARSVLDCSIPDDKGWDFISNNDLKGNDPDQKFDFLMKLDRPFIARVAISKWKDDIIDLDLRRYLNAGLALGNGGQQKERNWMCQPELFYMRQFAEIDIMAVFLARGYKKMNIKIPYLGELSDFSLSLGLLVESVMEGAQARSFSHLTGNRFLVTPRACWVRAADRFFSMSAALIMASAGFDVVSHGHGQVVIKIERNNVHKLIGYAPYAGLTVPVHLLKQFN